MKNRIDVAAVIENQAASRMQIALVILLAAAAFLEGFDAQIQGYTVPVLVKAWHIKQSGFSPVFVFFQIGLMAGAVLLGNLGDVVGRRTIIVPNVFLFGLFTIAGAYTHSVPMLALTRFLSAIFLGGAIPNAIALVVDYAPHGKRAFRVGMLYVLYAIGGSIGGFLSAWLVPTQGWQVVYLLCGALAAVYSIGLFAFLPESVRFLTARQRNLHLVARTLKRLDPSLHVDSDSEFYLPTTNTGRRAWVGELFAEKRAVMTIALWVAYAMGLMGLQFVTSWMPAIFATSGISYTKSVIATSLFQGGGAVGSVVGGWVLDRNKGILRLATLAFIGVPVIASIGHVAGITGLLMSLTFCAGLCIIGTQTGINALSSALYPTTLRSTGSGWASGVGRIGSILGPVAGGILIELHYSLIWIFALVAVPAFCVSMCLLTINSARPRAAGASDAQANYL